MQDMRRQLYAMGELQRRLLPRTLPRLAGWEVAAHYAVGSWPGGDYYDLLPFPDGRVLLLVADASDQGAPSTALVAMARLLIHSCPLTSGAERLPFCPFRRPAVQPPHVLLGHLNRVLHENSLEEQYLTAFCGVLDPRDGSFHFANAGHLAPRWWRAGPGRLEGLGGAVGQPLGLDPESSYQDQQVQTEPGDVLALYTDGLPGAVNARGQCFGRRPLEDALREAACRGAQTVKDAVLYRLHDFLGGREPQDDVTLLVLQRL